MKFLHMADMHFDTAFGFLSSRSNLGQIRRMDQRIIFSNIIDKIKSDGIKYLFISGDLYEQKFIRESTIDFINSKFKEIPDTFIFISPGNHDPFIKNSYYNNYNWANNVKIFNGELEKFETPDANIYGFGFTDYECSANINVNLEHNKPNILVMHASLDGQDAYNPITSVFLRSIGFDYVALGHIHKTNFDLNSNIIYPGSPISMGFDELGNHGIVCGELTDTLHLEFLNMDNKEFIEKYVDISEINSLEELIEYIDSLKIADYEICKIILTGSKHFDLPTNLWHLLQTNIVKVKDCTHLDYDLDIISKENSLKGIFVRNLLKRMDNNPDEKDLIENAINIGLEQFD